MSKANWIDSVVAYFSPRSGVQRLQARNAIDVLRKYEGATSGRRLSGWPTKSTSANAENGPALSALRNRSRDLVRNNPYAARAISVIEANVVGTGIMAGITANNPKQKEKVSGAWTDWSDSTDCDADGLHNLYGLQALTMRAIAEGGEALVVRRWRKPSDGYKIPVPYQIQVLEGDYIDTIKEADLDDGGFIRQGIEFNKQGRRVAYWLFKEHPGEASFVTRNQGVTSFRVPAEDVKHLYRVDRTGQIRGVSWGAPCLLRLSDLDSYEDAQLLRQKIAACFAGFVRDLGMPEDSTQTEEVFAQKLQAGTIQILPNGKTIEFPNVPTVSNDGHSERILRSIAMGFGVTYESLTGDLSNVNFSSGRMGWLEFHRNVVKWQWNMFIPRFCNPVFEWFKQSAEIMNIDTRGVRATWTPPRREMIDPTKEIPAIINAVRGGIQTLPEAIREQGYEFEDHLNDIKKSNELLDRLGIILDSDPRNVMKAGGLQQESNKDFVTSNKSGE